MSERVELAPDYSISRVINGCWQLTPDHGGGPSFERAIFDAFAERIDAGFTTFDCADIYAGTETLLGRFRRTLPDPDAIQVHTKLVPDKATLAELTDADIDSVIDRSRQRLGVDVIDLVQCHWWNYAVPGVERMCARLCEAQSRGKIRLIGATNFDTNHIRQLQDSGVPLVCVQAQYSLLDQRPARHMCAYAQQRGTHLLAYGVLAGGFLSERYLDQSAPQSINRSLQKYRLIIDDAGGWALFLQLLQVLEHIAQRHDTSIDLVAARWVLDQPAVAAVILGIGKVSRAQHNRGLFALRLDEDDHARIEQQLARHTQLAGDMYDLERDEQGHHVKVIKTNLQNVARPT